MKKILIIEDSEIFAQKTKSFLEKYGYLVELMPQCNDPDELLSRSDIDLLLLDLNLGENSKLHGEGVLEILKGKARFPIIIMTAHDDRVVQIIQYNVFTILRKPIELDLLLLNVKNAIKLGEFNSANIPNKSVIDYAIVTALYEEEFESVKEIFGLEIKKEYQIGNKNVYAGSLENYSNKKVIAVYQTEVGRTDASNLVTDIIKEFNPRYIFMTGVCGGNNKTSLGDIMIAKFVFTFDKGKISDTGFLREIELVKTHEQLIRIVRENNKKILSDVRARLAESDKREIAADFNLNDLKASIDPMACSSAVIDKENYFKEVISLIDRKASAVEMESFGFARAVESTNAGNTKGLVIKSVMDNTTNKTDHAKLYASYTSAMYLKSMLELGIIE